MKKEQKRLLSILIEKKRYVAYESLSEAKLNYMEIKELIINSFKNLFGEIGLSKAGIMFVDYKDNKGILKINNKYVDEVKASFSMIRKINKQDILVRSLRVSGTLKKVRGLTLIGGGL